MLDLLSMMGAVPLGAVGRAAAPSRYSLPAKGGTRMKKTLVSLFCVLALCLGLLPTAALAAGADAPNTLYVGSQALSNAEDSYWTTDSGNLAQSSETENWNVHYNPDTATLTLKNATIKTTHTSGNNAVIYAQSKTGSAVSLNIQLEGKNTIECSSALYGIYVNAEMSEQSYGTSASLTITGQGSLDVSGSAYGIWVKSGSGNASLTIENTSVVANTTSQYSSGVVVQSSIFSQSSPALSLAVNGGSLTASGGESSVGIQFNVALSEATNATTSLTVNNNAIVKAINGIGVSRVDKPIPSGTGIVFDDKEGTVYGNVTLDESLTVDQGETLTIPQGSTLNGNSYLTNNGTVTIENVGTLTGADAITNTGTINVENGGTMTGEPTGGKVVHAPTTITTDTLNAGTVGTAYSQTLAADNNPTKWTVTEGTLPAGLTLDETTGVISGTPTAAGTFDFTVTAANSAGSISKEFTLTVTQPVTGVKLNQSALTLVEGGTVTLIATVEPEDATNPAVTWSTNAENIATVDNGVVTAKAPGEATITATTVDGGYKATCKVTVQAKTYQISMDKSTLDFGSIFADNSVPGAQTVTVKNTGNQDVMLNLPASTYYNVTAVSGFSGTQATLTPNSTASFTVQPKTGLAAGTWQETLTVSGNNGVQAPLLCKLTVTAKTYNLSSDPGAIGFGTVNTGYTQPAAQVVVIKNTGNQALNLTQPKANNYGVGALSKTALNPGETATFIVQPKAGLGAGSYNETLTISGDGGAKATVNLTFSVQAPATATPAPTPLEIHTLHFDTNGGLPLEDVKFGLGAPVELWPYTPVRSGYLFQGWYSDQALTKAVSTVVLVKDTTIYAKWAPDPAATAQSGSTGSGSGSGSGSSGSSGGKGGSGTTITVTPAPTATATPTPDPTVTPTPEPTATPEATTPPEDTDKGSFPVVPVAAGAVILLVLVGGIVIFRRFRD